MATIHDYFSKFGFDDGDNHDLVEIARDHRDRVIAAINEAFSARNLPYKAIAVNYWTGHNPVRAEVERPGMPTWDYYRQDEEPVIVAVLDTVARKLPDVQAAFDGAKPVEWSTVRSALLWDGPASAAEMPGHLATACAGEPEWYAYATPEFLADMAAAGWIVLGHDGRYYNKGEEP